MQAEYGAFIEALCEDFGMEPGVTLTRRQFMTVLQQHMRAAVGCKPEEGFSTSPRVTPPGATAAVQEEKVKIPVSIEDLQPASSDIVTGQGVMKEGGAHGTRGSLVSAGQHGDPAGGKRLPEDEFTTRVKSSLQSRWQRALALSMAPSDAGTLPYWQEGGQTSDAAAAADDMLGEMVVKRSAPSMLELTQQVLGRREQGPARRVYTAAGGSSAPLPVIADAGESFDSVSAVGAGKSNATCLSAAGMKAKEGSDMDLTVDSSAAAAHNRTGKVPLSIVVPVEGNAEDVEAGLMGPRTSALTSPNGSRSAAPIRPESIATALQRHREQQEKGLLALAAAEKAPRVLGLQSRGSAGYPGVEQGAQLGLKQGGEVLRLQEAEATEGVGMILL
jgi:hypothetical protein